MNSKKTLLLAGLMCALLAACHSTDSNSLARSSSGENYAAPAGTTPQSAMPASTAASSDTNANMSSNMSSTMSSDTGQASLNISSATVQSIEAVPRSMDQGTGDMQAGTSGTAGSTSANVIYRVTLRLDDGTTRTFVQNSQPAFQIGDRVSVQKGVMQKY